MRYIIADVKGTCHHCKSATFRWNETDRRYECAMCPKPKPKAQR